MITVGFDSEDIYIERNYLDFDNYVSTLYSTTYLISTGGNSTDLGQKYPKNIWIRGNKCVNNPKWEGIDSHGSINLWIEDNYIYIYNCKIGITVGCQSSLEADTPAGATQEYTLPSSVLSENGSGLSIRESFNWSLINLSAGALNTITITSPGADHTFVGNAIVQSAHSTTGGLYGNSATFKTVKSALNTFVTYRIS